MDSDQRRRSLGIVAALRELPEAERGQFLDSACQDDAALRAEVQELLRSGPPDCPPAQVGSSMAPTRSVPFNAGDDAPTAAVETGGENRVWLEAGALIGPYQIEGRIGAGGMGVVYKARDLRLGRNVAIKVIKSHAANVQLEAALRREARLASSLNHAGIVTIYDILQNGGMTCIVMEFVRGSPLRDLIPPDGFPPEHGLALAIAIGEALALAHAAGVIHRDLKPSNILVRDDGQIKILDFGLAKLSHGRAGSGADDTSLFSGNTVGTVGYMAPEQARAEEVDERADIFSFGVILCELLIGKRPFRGENATAVLGALLTQDPESLQATKPEVSAALDSVVRRSLAKNPAQRYQTVREMLADLHNATRITAPPVSSVIAPAQVPAARVIAVLPLINMSADRESDYICDGLAEELIDGLMRIDSLRVVSRSSSFQFKGATPDVREIGKLLNAKLVVHGSLRRSGDKLRLSMQLCETDEGVQIWSQRFDAQAGDLFALEDELTAAVLEKLRDQLGAKLSGAEPLRHMPRPEAYDLYLQARFAFNHETPAEFRRALDLFQCSATADPAFAPAFIGIAETHMRLDWYGLEPAAEAVPAVKSALSTAFGMEPDSVAGLCNLALMQAGWDWNWNAAGESFKRALTAGGGSAAVHFHYGLDYLTPQGRLEEALAHLRYALQLDPLSPIVNTAVGGCLYRMRRWEESAEMLRSTLHVNPGFGHAYWSLGRVLLELGQSTEALQQFECAVKAMGPIPPAVAELGYCYARMGQRNLAHGTIQELQRLAERGWVSPLNPALVYAGLGEVNPAMASLEQALDKRIRQLVWVNVDPRFDPLRQTEAFSRLIERIGLTPFRLRPA